MYREDFARQKRIGLKTRKWTYGMEVITFGETAYQRVARHEFVGVVSRALPAVIYAAL